MSVRSRRSLSSRMKSLRRCRKTWISGRESSGRLSAEQRPPQAFGKELVQEERQPCLHAHILSGPLIDGDHRLDPDLDEASLPEDPWIHRPVRFPARSPVEKSLRRQFNDRNYPVERSAKAGVFHERLKVRKTVLDDHAPLQGVRVPLDIHQDLAAREPRRSRLGPRRDRAKRATVLYSLGALDEAIAACTKTLELEPRHFGALSGL